MSPFIFEKKILNFFLKIPLFFLTFCFLWTFFILVFLIISYNISFFQIFYRGGYSTIQLNANLKTLWFFVHCWYYLFYIFCSLMFKIQKIRHVLFSLCIVLLTISKNVIQNNYLFLQNNQNKNLIKCFVDLKLNNFFCLQKWFHDCFKQLLIPFM